MVKYELNNSFISQTITKLCDALSTAEYGAMVLKDLQLDVAKAHRRAHEVRQLIRRSLEPFIRVM